MEVACASADTLISDGSDNAIIQHTFDRDAEARAARAATVRSGARGLHPEGVSLRVLERGTRAKPVTRIPLCPPIGVPLEGTHAPETASTTCRLVVMCATGHCAKTGGQYGGGGYPRRWRIIAISYLRDRKAPAPPPAAKVDADDDVARRR